MLKEYSGIKQEIRNAIDEVVNKGWFIMGKKLKEFEKNFAGYSEAEYCVGVGNGMEALQIALMASGIGKGDEVITVANTFIATALAIKNVGAKPVFVDCNDYHLIDPSLIEEKITKKTKAIMPVHLFGQMADMLAIKKIADKYHLKIIEDAAQAHGAKQNNKRPGMYSDFACYSFYPTKNLGAYGDGGAITTNSKLFYQKCLLLRNYGSQEKYIHEVIGLNSRLDEIQAAILNVKLPFLNRIILAKQTFVYLYFKKLRDIDILPPDIVDGNLHTWHQLVIRTDKRDRLKNYLERKGIKTLIHYPIPIHKQKCFREYSGLKLPNTEKFAKEVLSLPMDLDLSSSDINIICTHIAKFFNK